MTTPRQTTAIIRPYLLIAGIILIAINLRAPITAIAPVLDQIRNTFGMATTEAGTLTTLPLLAFAIASPFCAYLARIYGVERSLLLSLLLIACGIILRSYGPAWALFSGTAIIGIGIAIANVLLPSLIKRDFPHRIALLTCIYATAAGVTAAIFSMVVVPITDWAGSGWRFSLGIMAVLPVLAILVWLPQLRNLSPSQRHAAIPTATQDSNIWQSGLAWQITFFFGFNSLIYYTIVTWMPQILMDAGYTAAMAGSVHGISQLATAIPGLFLAPLIGRLKDQRAITLGVAAITATALTGLIFVPEWGWLWAALFGIGSGAGFILGMALIGLRAANAPRAASLSAMTQCVGYLVAAGAPPIIGHLHDLTHSWTMPLSICIALCGIMALLGRGAGKAHRYA